MRQLLSAPAAIWSFCHAFPTMVVYIPSGTIRLNKIIIPSLDFVRLFYYNHRKIINALFKGHCKWCLACSSTSNLHLSQCHTWILYFSKCQGLSMRCRVGIMECLNVIKIFRFAFLVKPKELWITKKWRLHCAPWVDVTQDVWYAINIQ